jgi:CO/xanthine dehydrogenase FAD-binding subunit
MGKYWQTALQMARSMFAHAEVLMGKENHRARTCPDFFIGALTSDLWSDEMLVEVDLPSPKPRGGSCFMEAARRRGDFAIVGIATKITLGQRDECASARGGVALASAREATIGYAKIAQAFGAPQGAKCHRPSSALSAPHNVIRR